MVIPGLARQAIVQEKSVSSVIGNSVRCFIADAVCV